MGQGSFTEGFKLDAIKRITECDILKKAIAYFAKDAK